MSYPTPPRAPKTPDERVAGEVRAAMARHRVTGYQLAEALGMGRQSIQRRLDGKTPWRAGELIAAAVVLQVSPSTFTDVLAETQPAQSHPEPLAPTG